MRGGRRGVGGEGGLCWEWVVWGFMRVGGLFYAWERVCVGVGVGVGFMGVGFMRGRGSRLYAWGCGGFVLCVGVGVEWVVREGFVGSGWCGRTVRGHGRGLYAWGCVGFMRGGVCFRRGGGRGWRGRALLGAGGAGGLCVGVGFMRGGAWALCARGLFLLASHGHAWGRGRVVGVERVVREGTMRGGRRGRGLCWERVVREDCAWAWAWALCVGVGFMRGVGGVGLYARGGFVLCVGVGVGFRRGGGGTMRGGRGGRGLYAWG